MKYKNAILHFCFAFILALAFGLYGAIFVAGYFVGAEFMQMCYRSFADGYKWDDIWRKPLLLLKYAHVKDTAIDLLTYLVGVAGGLLCR